jgi:hypothetical protein
MPWMSVTVVPEATTARNRCQLAFSAYRRGMAITIYEVCAVTFLDAGGGPRRGRRLASGRSGAPGARAWCWRSALGARRGRRSVVPYWTDLLREVRAPAPERASRARQSSTDSRRSRPARVTRRAGSLGRTLCGTPGCRSVATRWQRTVQPRRRGHSRAFPGAQPIRPHAVGS